MCVRVHGGNLSTPQPKATIRRELWTTSCHWAPPGQASTGWAPASPCPQGDRRGCRLTWPQSARRGYGARPTGPPSQVRNGTRTTRPTVSGNCMGPDGPGPDPPPQLPARDPIPVAPCRRLQQARVRDHAALAGVDGCAGGGLDLRVVGDQGDLAEEVDELLGDPDEVAGGDVLGGQDVLEGVAAGPAVGGVGEAGVELAGQGEAAGLLVGVDLRLGGGQGGPGG